MQDNSIMKKPSLSKEEEIQRRERGSKLSNSLQFDILDPPPSISKGWIIFYFDYLNTTINQKIHTGENKIDD